MGNDGGSIAQRTELVKTKKRPEQADKKNQILALWFYCALSKKELSHPIVVCPLGRLFNKDALLEYLLNPASSTLPVSQTPFGADGQATAGHIRSLKDVIQLSLTPNPDYDARNKSQGQAGAEAGFGMAKWICPISQREMNGSTRFIYLKHCGNVVAETALKELRAASKQTDTTAPCSICGAEYKEGESESGYVINPAKEESDRLKAAWELQKANERALKKSKKRKAEQDVSLDVKTKKVQTIDTSTNLQNGAPKLPSEIAAALEAKKAAIARTAVGSLYRQKEDTMAKKPDSDWMIRSTFSR